jgi:mono/diheme cytochrome c family protein
VTKLVVGSAVLLVAIQFVPYGRNHSNPKVVREPVWDRASTRQLAVNACFDCHSNETRWPWYSHVAPVSWLVQSEVDHGRHVLNFSEWQRTYDEARESAESVVDSQMPPERYLVLHSSARLSPEDKRALAQGLSATLGPSTPRSD